MNVGSIYSSIKHQRVKRRARAFIDRQSRRAVDWVPNTTQASAIARTKALVVFGKKLDPGWSRLPRIPHRVLVTNGRHDIMFLTINSYTLSKHVPNTTLILYPESGHGSLFQYNTLFLELAIRFFEAGSLMIGLEPAAA